MTLEEKDQGLIHTIHVVSIFGISYNLEQEASILVTEYLLDDKVVLKMLNTDNTFFTTAS